MLDAQGDSNSKGDNLSREKNSSKKDLGSDLVDTGKDEEPHRKFVQSAGDEEEALLNR